MSTFRYGTEETKRICPTQQSTHVFTILTHIYLSIFVCVFCPVGLISPRIDCCTNNNYQPIQHFSKLPTSQLHATSQNHATSQIQSNTSSLPFQNLNQAQIQHRIPPCGSTTNSTLPRRPSFTLQSPLQHRPIVENIISDHSNSYRIQTSDPFNFNSTNKRAYSLRRSDSYSPGN